MRTYYIFNISGYISYIYKKKPYKIYKMLEEIYNINKRDIVLSYKYFEQIAKTFNKNKLNEYINKKLEENEFYHINEWIHIYISKNEYSKLTVGNSNLKIKTNVNYPTFFDYIDNYVDDIFVCDFINKDYFWLEDIAKKDCQNDKYLVK